MSHAADHIVMSLRCTAFEEFMLDQDSAEFPCVICLRIELKGNVDTQRLSEALRRLVAQHPLLRARLQCHFAKLHWIVDPAGTTDLHVHHQRAPQWPVRQYFDLSQEFGLRADLYPAQPADSELGAADSPTWTVLMQVHHAIADGLGCLQLVEEWLAEYARPDQSKPRQGVEELRERNRFGLSLVGMLRLVPQQLVGLAGVRQFLSRRPAPMSPRTVSGDSSPDFAAVTYRCTSAQSQQLKQDAKQRQATLNDLLACLVFEACDQYRQMQMSYRGSEWLRMMVPINLRDPQTQYMSACNVVSCVFLDRTGEQISDRNELLKSIHEEMELIKGHRLAFVFIFSLWLKKIFRWRTRGRALVTSPPSRCQTSIVFSNMGRLFEATSLPTSTDGRLVADGVTLHSCEVLAPIAPLTRVAITTYQYAGRLTISLRYDSSVFGAADAERLLGLIVQRVDCQTPESGQA